MHIFSFIPMYVLHFQLVSVCKLNFTCSLNIWYRKSTVYYKKKNHVPSFWSLGVMWEYSFYKYRLNTYSNKIINQFKIKCIKKITWLTFDIDTASGLPRPKVCPLDMWTGDGCLFKDLKEDNSLLLNKIFRYKSLGSDFLS